MDTVEKIKQQIAEAPILLYMKGSAERPQCGYSAKAVQALNACNATFSTVDVLENPDIRQTLPQVANWPTFPQLYIRGKLIGGSDIVLQLFASGELQKLIDSAT